MAAIVWWSGEPVMLMTTAEAHMLEKDAKHHRVAQRSTRKWTDLRSAGSAGPATKATGRFPNVSRQTNGLKEILTTRDYT